MWRYLLKQVFLVWRLHDILTMILFVVVLFVLHWLIGMNYLLSLGCASFAQCAVYKGELDEKIRRLRDGED